jgi:hypothetical protein
VSEEPLPWERAGGANGVGVCLSGGGLRAASFALGAIQALQQERGLLFGPKSARHLAVVSGGSYIAATHMLNATKLSGAKEYTEPPLADGTPEANHVIAHGNYLKNLSTMGRLGLAGALNLTAFGALYLWTGTMLAGALAITADGAGIGSPHKDIPLATVGVLAFLVGGRLVLYGLYKDGGWRRWLMPLLGGAVLFVGSPSILAGMQRFGALSEWQWWTQDARLLTGMGACAAILLLAAALAKFRPNNSVSHAVVSLAVRVPIAIGLVLFCLAATSVFDVIDAGVQANATNDAKADAGELFFGILFGAFALQWVAARASLHRLYRDQLASCYSVHRERDGVQPVASTAQMLSALAPPEPGAAGSFPRLLICATANIVWDPAQPARPSSLAPRRHDKRTYASLVYSHDRCGLAGVPGASFATTDLEALKAPAPVLPSGREPLVSLMTGVASTGAAISPAMGRRTSRVFRPVIALMNLRLGRWLPNPLSLRVRGDLPTPSGRRRFKRRRALGGYDDFVPELFGLHRADAPRVYISDGGHYDNLGLIALLHARCREIWCVDSEADPTGGANQLRAVIRLAKEELDASIDIDVKVFEPVDDGVLGAGHAVGTITYSDNSTASLVVIKLGLTPDSPAELKDYRGRDKRFPYHGTFWPPWQVTWYGPVRVDHYRKIGFFNARTASDDVQQHEQNQRPDRGQQ